ncbi:hypothetical protein OG800_50620 (plasmid) [Streptomyces sp. NBC_00445]|uniref:hypothetical protein n=1 Tax=Streptomyces sp. NBC_00445 TaxID=2975745 RepID=UPI002E22710A
MQTHVLSVRRTAAALACAAALVSLTACENSASSAESTGGTAPSTAAKASPTSESNGIEDLSAKEIYNKSRQAIADAGSFREKMTRDDAKSDLLISATECVGTVEMSQQGSFEIIRKGDDVWAKLDAELAKWVTQQAGTTLSADTWIHGAPAHPLMQGFVSWCHQKQITDPDTASADLKPTKGKVTTVDGQQAVPIKITGKGESVTWYAATTGKPYYIKQDSTREDMADIELSDFGKPVNAKAPSAPVEEVPKE